MEAVRLFSSISPVYQALVATLFTWFVTALGAAVVFLKKDINRKALDASLGFASGIMISASFFSLILPAIGFAEGSKIPSWVPVSIGFLLGGFCLRLLDRVIPHLHLFSPEEKAEGIKTNLPKTALLILAITIHNLPEGLAVGVAFGSLGTAEGSSLWGAVALAVGIAIQNFPEGIAVSLPLRREGMSPFKSFWYGQLSAIVEPIGGVIGASMVLLSKALLPYALSFAAGAMIFVVIEELIPESQSGENGDIATTGAIIGFVVMMILDLALS
jgi:ZIP family zinc transporter